MFFYIFIIFLEKKLSIFDNKTLSVFKFVSEILDYIRVICV